MIFQFVIVFLSVYVTSAAVLLPSASSIQPIDEEKLNVLKPNEVFPIQPTLIYPSVKKMTHRERALFKNNEIIYIKLLKRKGYRPKKVKNHIHLKHEQMKDIFYVKALANGQFSHNRLKMYRLPEFYAITVYKEGQLKE